MAFVEDEPAVTICAFCLMTSAGVRMAQDTSSARDDAPACTTAIGRTPFGDEVVVLRRVKSDLVRSYVVKNAPAVPCQFRNLTRRYLSRFKWADSYKTVMSL